MHPALFPSLERTLLWISLQKIKKNDILGCFPQWLAPRNVLIWREEEKLVWKSSFQNQNGSKLVGFLHRILGMVVFFFFYFSSNIREAFSSYTNHFFLHPTYFFIISTLPLHIPIQIVNPYGSIQIDNPDWPIRIRMDPSYIFKKLIIISKLIVTKFVM